jgi:predicted nucleotidyltransferase
MLFDLEKSTILLATAGSRAYGISKKNSDIDIKGVAIPDQRYYLGFLNKFEQSDKSQDIQVFTKYLTEEEQRVCEESKLEGCVYELTKFIKLASDANPNILDVLFCRNQDIKLQTDIGEELRHNAGLFLSAKAKHTFSGYAFAQLKRIKTHRAYLLNPRVDEPKRKDYGLPETTIYPKDQLEAINSAIQKKIESWAIDYGQMENSEKVYIEGQISNFLSEITQGISEKDMQWLAAAKSLSIDSNFIDLMTREKKYRSARIEFEQYQTWKKNQNKDRAALEEKYLYDTKHGAHLVRLMRMGVEILTTGKVNVWRGKETTNDAEELIAIRNGSWTYEQLIEWAEQKEMEIDDIYNNKKYIVKPSPDRNKIDELCISLISKAIK